MGILSQLQILVWSFPKIAVLCKHNTYMHIPPHIFVSIYFRMLENNQVKNSADRTWWTCRLDDHRSYFKVLVLKDYQRTDTDFKGHAIQVYFKHKKGWDSRILKVSKNNEHLDSILTRHVYNITQPIFSCLGGFSFNHMDVIKNKNGILLHYAFQLYWNWWLYGLHNIKNQYFLLFFFLSSPSSLHLHHLSVL